MHKYESYYAKVVEVRLSLSLDPIFQLLLQRMSATIVLNFVLFSRAFILQTTNVSRMSKTE